MEELKLCPFCGCKAVVIDTGNHWPQKFYRVVAEKSCCMQAKLYKTPEEAAHDWNRRAQNEPFN